VTRADGEPALFLRRVDATAWDNAFINHDRTGWFPRRLRGDEALPRPLPANLVSCESLGGLNSNATLSETQDPRLEVVTRTRRRRPASSTSAGLPRQKGKQWVVKAGLEERNTLEEPNHIAPWGRRCPPAAHPSSTRFRLLVTVMELRTGR